ncbi:LuxR C-terminal-related transcriptional regulator [Oceanobacillus sojae]|uniref:LuxR C-terminal-related transcriptional regulator n=1 Tax=Oceanobacillus sojae TaxID=582851 RepID=UPI0021A5743A|nr:LuxR C-terminal-related transcriptional regulator [Oceanobacillus sojae]MCT1905019.1 LuxR C-terminal-related transcriptional regulator [Oceanobacillus sojae]
MTIIATKLHIPRHRLPLVERVRLFQRLDKGVNHELTLIVAPAGYGKTTLLSEWARTLSQPVAWVSFDQRDNDPVRFREHTIAALKQSCPEFDEQAVLQHAAEDTAGDSLIAALINELHRLSETQIIIWDDFHLITDALILKGVLYLIERLPAHTHLYIASRTPPALSLSKLRANNKLNGLEADDLRFNTEETTDFFRKSCDMQLSVQEAAAVQERTEGWATAMRLSVMSLPKQADPEALIQKMSGMDCDISNYFLEEVFSLQPETIQQFLMQTSILNRMTGGLCEAVTGKIESEVYLQFLDQNSLFLVPLDERREWYRYYHLFQAFLIRQLKYSQPHEWQRLHTTAGKWLEEKGYADEAIDHYLMAKEYESALSLLEEMASGKAIKEWTMLGVWLNVIPDSFLFDKPMMLLTKLAAQYLSGRTEAATKGYWKAVHKLEQDVHSLSSETSQILQAGLAFLTAFRTFLDRDFEFTVEYSKEYVEKHPPGDLFVGFGNDRVGYHPLWEIYVSDNSLRLAEQVVISLLDIWSETKHAHFVAHLHIDLGKLHYERNRLREAERHMRCAYDIGKSCDNRSLIIIAELWLASIAAVQGEWDTANNKIQKLEKQIITEGSLHLSKRVVLFQATLAKIQEDEKQVNQWLKTSGLNYTDEIPLSMSREYSLFATILIERGQMEKAAALIERLFQIENKIGRQGNRIRLLISQSRMLSLQGKIAQSMETLEEALALAYPENYIRTFVDEGAPLGELLDQYIKMRQNQHRQPDKKVPLTYVKRLHRLIFPLDKGMNKSFVENSYKPSITIKEKSVLDLMDKGLSNKEIAEELNVSLSTVKTHINNIYSKLQVKNRLQALELARAYELF